MLDCGLRFRDLGLQVLGHDKIGEARTALSVLDQPDPSHRLGGDSPLSRQTVKVLVHCQ